MIRRPPGHILLLTCSVFLQAGLPGVRGDALAEQKAFADGLFSRGLHAMAITEYRKALDTNPPPDQAEEILFRLAESYRAEGNQAEADTCYRRVMTEHPDGSYRFKAEFRRTELYIAGSRYADAKVLLEELVAANPPDDIRGSAWYFLGYCHERTDQLEEAASAFQQVVDGATDHPYLPYACLALAAVHGKSGRADAATIDLLNRARQLAPTDRLKAEAQFHLADVAFRQQDYAASAAAYRQLLQDYPEDRRAAEAPLQAAWSYLNAGRHQDVIELVRQHRDAAPEERGEWWYLQANALRGMGRTEDAVGAYAEFRRALPDHPRVKAAAYEEGLVLFRQGNFTATLALLDELPSTADYAEDLDWLRAEAAAGAGDVGQAKTSLRQILDRYPEADRTPDALNRLARLLQDQGESAAAIAEYRTFLDRYPDHRSVVDAWIGVAYCQTQLGQYEEAWASWQAITGRQPEPPQLEAALFQRGLVELHLEKWTEARETFRGYRGRYPDSARAGAAAYWLATIHDRLTDYSAAELAFRDARSANVDEALRLKAVSGLATVLKKQEKDAEAADLWHSLLHAGNGDGLDAPLLEWLARFQFQRGRLQEAAIAAEALATDGSGADWSEIGWYLHGEALAAQGDHAAAAPAWRRAAEGTAGTRESVEAAFRLAEYSRDAGDWPVAETYFEMCGQRATSTDMIDLRARSYYGLGEAAAAREAWDDAARLFMSVGILFDHPELTPDALFQARSAFARLGQVEEQQNVADELRRRYPESEWVGQLELERE